MIRKIKNSIPETIKGQIISKFKPSYDVDLEKYRGKKKIIVGLGGFYQNLGDMAITYAQKKFLQTNFPDYEIVLFPSTWTYSKMKALKSVCSREDIITTVGGGNMDESYTSLEDARRFIIKSFPNNRIISFPQTITFSTTDYGKKRLKKTVRTYSKHKDLKLFAREKNSFEKMKTNFPRNIVEYCPDIVMSLDKATPELERKGVIYCVRNDMESHLTQTQKNDLLKSIKSTFNELTITDTVNITMEQSSPLNFEKTLEDFWELLRGSEIVITDRLHCMIFCAITKTPCVVLPNSNQKIKGTYNELLNELEFIKFIEKFDTSEIIKTMSNFKKLNADHKSELNLEEKYRVLRDAVAGEF